MYLRYFDKETEDIEELKHYIKRMERNYIDLQRDKTLYYIELELLRHGIKTEFDFKEKKYIYITCNKDKCSVRIIIEDNDDCIINNGNNIIDLIKNEIDKLSVK